MNAATTRILAVDQGSNECGFAYLEGETVRDVDVMRPKRSMPWAERMDYIAEQLIHATYSRKWEPDIVGIESVVIWRNVKMALTMGETRGYLKRLVRELYPRARIIDINPSETKAAVGASRYRDESKQRAQLVVGAMTGRTNLSEDEADAVAIAWAVRTKLERERLERLADPGEQMVLPP